MAITASGVGSGLDIENIVSQLMTLERQPLVALQRKESEYKAQLSPSKECHLVVKRRHGRPR